jgi:hypothetical protein
VCLNCLLIFVYSQIISPVRCHRLAISNLQPLITLLQYLLCRTRYRNTPVPNDRTCTPGGYHGAFSQIEPHRCGDFHNVVQLLFDEGVHDLAHGRVEPRLVVALKKGERERGFSGPSEQTICPSASRGADSTAGGRKTRLEHKVLIVTTFLGLQGFRKRRKN